MQSKSKKIISTAIISLFILSMFSAALLTLASPSSSPPYTFEEIGNGVAGWTTEENHSGIYSVRLYVEDGSTDWAGVDIKVDIPIEDVWELKFWEKIDLLGEKGWDVAVYLGVDTDKDGVFEADRGAWHFSYDPDDLNGDSFVGNDGQLGKPGGLTGDVPWTQVDALGTYAWSWSTSPNVTGNGLATWGHTSITNFTVFLEVLDTPNDDSRIDKDHRVKLIKFVIGGSGSWQNQIAYVDDITINGVAYPLELEPIIIGILEEIEAKLDDIVIPLLDDVKGEVEAIENKLDSWFGTGGKFSNTAQATSGGGTTTFTASGSYTLYTGTKVGTVTVSFRTTGIGFGESLRVRYYTDPSAPAVFIQKTVTANLNTLGWTDTAAAWKVEIDHTWRSGTNTVNWAYSAIYPP